MIHDRDQCSTVGYSESASMSESHTVPSFQKTVCQTGPGSLEGIRYDAAGEDRHLTCLCECVRLFVCVWLYVWFTGLLHGGVGLGLRFVVVGRGVLVLYRLTWPWRPKGSIFPFHLSPFHIMLSCQILKNESPENQPYRKDWMSWWGD